jgi:hypothetical protein
LFLDRRRKQYATDMAAPYEGGQPIDVRFSLFGLVSRAHAVGEQFYPKSVGCTFYAASGSRCLFRRAYDCKATFKPGRAEFS